MFRVTHNIMAKDAVYNINTHQSRMTDLQNNISTGKKVRLPHEDPVAATHSMLYRTRISEIRQFINNIKEGKSRLEIAEGAIRSAVDILHRLEELTVQGANGTYTQEDRAKIAVEIDELLKQMIEIANTKFKGESIFAGFQTDRVPFEPLTTRPSFADREVITKVKYHGDIGQLNREIEQEVYSPANLNGNRIFWATRETVTGNVNVTNFVANQNFKIRIDNKIIQINAGDNINTIVNKINTAKIPVQADVVNNRFVIKNLTPRELWLEDIEGGNLLQQLGIKDANQMPNEVSMNATRTGMSIFDVMIKLRDDLWQNNVKALGGEDLGLLNQGLNNMLTYLGELGARTKRFETVLRKLNMEEVDMTDILAKTENIDMAKSITDLQMLEYVHRASLAVTARIIRPTLMDFLR